MSKIIELPEVLANQIAAGEVVERPASVVKELVENSIDAGSSQITIEIEESGLKKIQVTDNGEGISQEDVALSLHRHATSKIKSQADLFRIRTLGFRGEALSSIAAVSQVELITKTYGELTGTRYVIEGSKEKENEESMTSMPCFGDLELQNLSFSYEKDKAVVSDVNISFPKGSKTVLIGRNGSGKSTITAFFDKVGKYTNADDVVATTGMNNMELLFG